MKTRLHQIRFSGLILFLVLPALFSPARSQTASGQAHSQRQLFEALPPRQWSRVEASVDLGLTWIAGQQQPDGSFRAPAQGQPAITSLAVMAFLSRGHQPGLGPYGQQLERAVDYVLKCQKESGLLSSQHPEPHHVHLGASHTATYNHAIAGLMLGEVYGAISGPQSDRIKTAIEKALEFTRNVQLGGKLRPQDQGGWRYLHKFQGSHSPSDSDLSVTGWKILFLRSAKNAEFDVPEEHIQAALDYVERCFDPHGKVFYYGLIGNDRYTSRAMMGAGALSLSMGGRHHQQMALIAGEWILAHPFNRYGETITGRGDRFHYGAYYCSQAMAQLGGRYWEQFFPTLAQTLVASQSPAGSWQPERMDDIFGAVYTTALSVLSLTPPYQLLPIYQR